MKVTIYESDNWNFDDVISMVFEMVTSKHKTIHCFDHTLV